MKTFTTQIRVRYGETDQMGYVYYGNYAQYFEVARVELMRDLDMSYKSMEDQGYILPVMEFSIKFFAPAFYDDLLTIKTSIAEVPTSLIIFNYETFNSKGELLNKAQTKLVFASKETGKPTRSPKLLRDRIEAIIEG